MARPTSTKKKYTFAWQCCKLWWCCGYTFILNHVFMTFWNLYQKVFVFRRLLSFEPGVSKAHHKLDLLQAHQVVVSISICAQEITEILAVHSGWNISNNTLIVNDIQIKSYCVVSMDRTFIHLHLRVLFSFIFLAFRTYLLHQPVVSLKSV